jgi:hypothetical protein
MTQARKSKPKTRMVKQREIGKNKPISRKTVKTAVRKKPEMLVRWNGLELETVAHMRTLATVGGTDKGWVIFCLGHQKAIDPKIETEEQAKREAWIFFKEKMAELNEAAEPEELNLDASRKTYKERASRSYGC